jgi:hypothetical protein
MRESAGLRDGRWSVVSTRHSSERQEQSPFRIRRCRHGADGADQSRALERRYLSGKKGSACQTGCHSGRSTLAQLPVRAEARFIQHATIPSSIPSTLISSLRIAVPPCPCTTELRKRIASDVPCVPSGTLCASPRRCSFARLPASTQPRQAASGRSVAVKRSRLASHYGDQFEFLQQVSQLARPSWQRQPRCMPGWAYC